MAFPELISFLVSHRAPILCFFFLAPWISYLLCVLIPGKNEEPFILNLNLVLALGSLIAEIGYISYVSWRYDFSLIVEKTEILFLAAPIYYVGMSLWLSSQRLPLQRLSVYRVVQGIAMISGAYLFIAWLLSRVRIYFFGYLPFSWFLVILLAALGIAYLGYQRIFHSSKDESSTDSTSKGTRKQSRTSSSSPFSSVELELEEMRRDMKTGL